MASACTGELLVFGGFWAAPRCRMRDQLLRLDFVKYICSVVSSQQRQRAASNDSITWSATSVSPVSLSWSVVKQNLTFFIQARDISRSKSSRDGKVSSFYYSACEALVWLLYWYVVHWNWWKLMLFWDRVSLEYLNLCCSTVMQLLFFGVDL